MTTPAKSVMIRAVIVDDEQPARRQMRERLSAHPQVVIVGEADPEVLALNREARRAMTAARTELAVVPRASHLFEEAGALEAVARLAANWFVAHLPTTPATPPLPPSLPPERP